MYSQLKGHTGTVVGLVAEGTVPAIIMGGVLGQPWVVLLKTSYSILLAFLMVCRVAVTVDVVDALQAVAHQGVVQAMYLLLILVLVDVTLTVGQVDVDQAVVQVQPQ